MPQFRSIPSYNSFEDTEGHAMVEQSLPVVPSIPVPPTISPLRTPNRVVGVGTNANHSASLFKHPGVTTEELTAIRVQTDALVPETGPSLMAALQSTIPQATTGRLTVIPAELKRSRTGGRAQKRRMNAHLRHSIVITAILSVFMLTLVSLAPLDNGQSTFHFFSGVGNWVHDGQLAWLLESQTQPQQAKQSNPNTVKTQAPAPPAMMLPRSQYVAIAEQDAINAGIPPTYFVRQINQESGFNANALSPAGAVGIAQFLPSTAAGLGVNPYDPISALRGAANLMASYSRQYNGNYAMALAAYNGGTGTVQYATNNCGANWLNCLPAETRNYIYVIMGI